MHFCPSSSCQTCGIHRYQIKTFQSRMKFVIPNNVDYILGCWQHLNSLNWHKFSSPDNYDFSELFDIYSCNLHCLKLLVIWSSWLPNQVKNSENESKQKVNASHNPPLHIIKVKHYTQIIVSDDNPTISLLALNDRNLIKIFVGF